MPRQPSSRSANGQAAPIKDLPIEAAEIKHSEQVVGGGGRKPEPKPVVTESLTLNFSKPELKD